jgi:hypothetical protein
MQGYSLMETTIPIIIAGGEESLIINGWYKRYLLFILYYNIIFTAVFLGSRPVR